VSLDDSLLFIVSRASSCVVSTSESSLMLPRRIDVPPIDPSSSVFPPKPSYARQESAGGQTKRASKSPVGGNNSRR
jgi:hypothetical protein